MLLKSCFFGDLSPSSAEDILIKQMSKSFLVRQCDRDPSKLILVFIREDKITHIIIPDFDTEGFSRRLIKNRLEEKTTDEVDKLLDFFDCHHPVIPDIPVDPVPQWKKRSKELTGGAGRCSICPAVGDPKKIVLHYSNHHVKLCQNCGKFVMIKNFSHHSKKCTYDREKLLTCPHEKCDYSSFHKTHLTKHERAVHIKPFVCELEECVKKFGTKQQLDKHMEKHGKKKKNKGNLVKHERAVHSKRPSTSKYESNPIKIYECSSCDDTFMTRQQLWRHKKRGHMHNVSKLEKFKSRNMSRHLCPKCDYKAPMKKMIEKHLITHKPKHKYQCEDCPFSTNLKRPFEQHNARFHNKKEETVVIVTF